MKHPIVIANLLGVDGKQTTISSDLCLQISLCNASNKNHNLTSQTHRTKRFPNEILCRYKLMWVNYPLLVQRKRKHAQWVLRTNISVWHFIIYIEGTPYWWFKQLIKLIPVLFERQLMRAQYRSKRNRTWKRERERELHLLEYNAEAQAEQGKTTQRKLLPWPRKETKKSICFAMSLNCNIPEFNFLSFLFFFFPFVNSLL